jgi:putative endonuclease
VSRRSGSASRPRAAPRCCSSPRAIESWPGGGKRRRDLIFVEVKARDHADAAADGVTARGKRRIIAAAELWLAHHPDAAQSYIRFDVILVAPGKMPRHIVNAFDAST